MYCTMISLYPTILLRYQERLKSPVEELTQNIADSATNDTALSIVLASSLAKFLKASDQASK